MKFGKEKSKEIQEKVKKILQEKQDKAEAISEAVEILAEEKYADLIEQLKEEQEKSKAAITIEKKYAMGFSGFKVDEYKETKALDDADLLIGKVYANGRAVDDNVAFVFDVTKLEEYIPKVKVINAQEVAEA